MSTVHIQNSVIIKKLMQHDRIRIYFKQSLKMKCNFIYFATRNLFTNTVRVFNTKAAVTRFPQRQCALQEILIQYVELL
jgi:hypothetical protein